MNQANQRPLEASLSFGMICGAHDLSFLGYEEVYSGQNMVAGMTNGSNCEVME